MATVTGLVKRTRTDVRSVTWGASPSSQKLQTPGRSTAKTTAIFGISLEALMEKQKHSYPDLHVPLFVRRGKCSHDWLNSLHKLWITSWSTAPQHWEYSGESAAGFIVLTVISISAAWSEVAQLKEVCEIHPLLSPLTEAGSRYSSLYRFSE